MTRRRLLIFGGLLSTLCWPTADQAAEFGRDSLRRDEERREERERREQVSRPSEWERELDADLRNRVEKALNEKNYEAYRREKNGESLGTSPRTGKSWDHRIKVRQYQQGLEWNIGRVKQRMSDPRVSTEERGRLRERLSDMSRILDESEERTGQTPEERRQLDEVIRARALAGR